MSRHVLVPIDGSRPARAALDHVIEQFPDAELTLLYVVDPMADYSRHLAFPGYTAEDEYSSEREKGEAVLEAARENAESAREDSSGDTRIQTAIEVGSPGRTIVEYADAHDVDGIVLGSHGREGAARVLLGSVAEEVVRRSGVPVTIVRGEAPS